MRVFLTTILLAAAMLLTAAETAKIRCTTYPVWLLTAEIAQGSGASVELVIPPGTGCPHDYVLVPGDVEKLSEPNQLIVVNGLGMDDFIRKAIAKVNPNVPVIEAASADEKTALSDAEGGWNPHWFASPDTARQMVRNIADGLARNDALHAGRYRENAAKLDAGLAGLEKRFAALAPADGSNAPTVVIQHGIFSYLARLVGCNAIWLSESDDETNLTPVQLRQLVRKVRKENACAIWADVHSPQGAVEALARECHLPVIKLDMLSGGPAVPPEGHFLRTLEADLRAIEKSLGH